VGRVVCGVPQGSVLGPQLFTSYIIYINSVSQVIMNCRFHIYADDLQLVEDFQQCVGDVNEDLKRVFNWAKENGLKINPTKSQVIVIHRCKTEVPEPSLYIGDDEIKVVPKVVNLHTWKKLGKNNFFYLVK
jgi:Reverse transcriptase (RNA-dependent DNA polymerase)